MKRNNLTGTVPTNIGDLTKLQLLYDWLESCCLELASWFLTMQPIRDISDNQFSGTIPSTIGLLTALLNLYVRLVGWSISPLHDDVMQPCGPLQPYANQSPLWNHSINSWLAPKLGSHVRRRPFECSHKIRLHNLTVGVDNRNLASNELSGPLPSEIGLLTKLTQLYGLSTRYLFLSRWFDCSKGTCTATNSWEPFRWRFVRLWVLNCCTFSINGSRWILFITFIRCASSIIATWAWTSSMDLFHWALNFRIYESCMSFFDGGLLTNTDNNFIFVVRQRIER